MCLTLITISVILSQLLLCYLAMTGRLMFCSLLKAFTSLLSSRKLSGGWLSVNTKPSRAVVSVARRRTQLFHHHCAHNYTKAGISVCLPPCNPLIFIIVSLPPPSPPPPLFLPGVCCLVPPLGCSTDAGWRHSSLILLLLMLMLKEAIGTCYFCSYPISPSPQKGY